MAHSHHEHRAHKHSRHRADHIIKSGGHLADGGTANATQAIGSHSDPNTFFEQSVPGKKRGGRLNKYARGGAAKKHHTQVNIAVVAPHGKDKDSGAGAAPAPGAPPMGAHPPIAPPPGGMPPGLPPGMAPPGGPPGLMPPGMPPRPPMKRGGRIKKLARGGGANKLAPLEKIGRKGGMDSGEGRIEVHNFQKKIRPK